MEPHANLVYFLIHWLVSAVAVLATARLIRGFHVKGFGAAIFAAAVIGILNVVLWPLLIFLTLPVNVITLGLFTFVVNGAILKISAWLLPGFEIEGWLAAIFGALVLSLLGTVMHFILV